MKIRHLSISVLFLLSAIAVQGQQVKENVVILRTERINKGIIKSWTDSVIVLQKVVSRSKKADSLTEQLDTFHYSSINEIRMTRAKIDRSSVASGMFIGTIGGAALGAVLGYTIAMDDASSSNSGCNDEPCCVLGVYGITAGCAVAGGTVGLFAGTLFGNMAGAGKSKVSITRDHARFLKARSYFNNRYKLNL